MERPFKCGCLRSQAFNEKTQIYATEISRYRGHGCAGAAHDQSIRLLAHRMVNPLNEAVNVFGDWLYY